MKEAYDNKDVVAQIYAIRDTAESAEDTAEQAVTTANTASDHVDALVPQVEGAVQNANSASASAQASAQTVAGYENRLGAIEGDVVQLNTDVDGVTVRVTTAEGQIVTIQGRVTALETADGQNVKLTGEHAIGNYAVLLTDNQDVTGIKNNLTEGKLYVVVGGSTERWVRLAHTNIADSAGEFTVFPDKQTGLGDAMKAWFQIRQNICQFRYMNTVGVLDTARYAMTFDGSEFEIWYHYTTNDTNHRITVVFDGMSIGRVMTPDGVTSKTTMNPSDYVLYQNPVIL